MITSEMRVKINIDREDREQIKAAANTLESIIEAFSKAGSHTETETTQLKGAVHILDEILRDETF